MDALKRDKHQVFSVNGSMWGADNRTRGSRKNGREKINRKFTMNHNTSSNSKKKLFPRKVLIRWRKAL
jgi:hypothetical protein